MKNTCIKTAAKAHRCAASFAAIFLKVFGGMSLLGAASSLHAMDHDPMYSFTRAELSVGQVQSPSAPVRSLALDGWYGGDKNRLWWQVDAGWQDGRDSGRGIGAWYGHYFAPFWDAQIGVRHESSPGNADNFLSAGVRGLAPYQYDTDIKLDVRSDGKLFLHAHLEQELLLTNHWILTPMASLSASAAEVDATVRRGLYQAAAGVRLRYEFSRRFAPFIEVSRTVHPLSSAGGEPASTRYSAGLRFVF